MGDREVVTASAYCRVGKDGLSMPRQRIFVSAATRDLGNYRELASKTLRERGYVVDDQAIFSLTYQEIGEKLKQRIVGCDAVVCLIGSVYGGEPTNSPPDQPRRSYTQWEYFVARELGKDVYLLLAGEETPFDPDPRQPESDELRQLQKDYRAEVIHNRDWRSFANKDQLRAELALLRSVGRAPPDHKPNNLPDVPLGTLFKGRAEFLDDLRQMLGAVRRSGDGDHCPAGGAWPRGRGQDPRGDRVRLAVCQATIPPCCLSRPLPPLSSAPSWPTWSACSRSPRPRRQSSRAWPRC